MDDVNQGSVEHIGDPGDGCLDRNALLAGDLPVGWTQSFRKVRDLRLKVFDLLLRFFRARPVQAVPVFRYIGFQADNLRLLTAAMDFEQGETLANAALRD